MSDVRITFSDGSERDMLQKAYPLGPYVIGGFAGSVRIGFELLNSLQYGLEPPDHDGPLGSHWTWEPAGIAHEWQPIAKTIFCQRCHCGRASVRFTHLDRSGSAMKDSPTMLHKRLTLFSDRAPSSFGMMSPEFEPLVNSRQLSVEHIGSGAYVEKYVEPHETLFLIRCRSTLQSETAAFGMWPKMLARGVRQIVSDDPVSGISPHVHILLCRSGHISMLTNDTTIVPKGKDPIEFKMPKVARGYAQFFGNCSATGVTAAGARG